MDILGPQARQRAAPAAAQQAAQANRVVPGRQMGPFAQMPPMPAFQAFPVPMGPEPPVAGPGKSNFVDLQFERIN